MLKAYRVTLPNGTHTVLRLSPETAERDYPDAIEVKVAPGPVVKDAPRAKATRKRPAK